MYTASVENESAFLFNLIQSHSYSTKDDEETTVGTCPKCKNGNVLTRCTHSVSGESESWHFDHRCDTCGEIFNISRIRSDIFRHTPHQMLDSIETPFGSITVKRNGQTIRFRCRNDHYEIAEDTPGKPVQMKIIDIDTSVFESGDFVFCGFDEEILEYNDSDERSVLFSCENGNLLLGLCAYEPDEWEENAYCYRLYEGNKKGFMYRVVSDPREFDMIEFYQSTIVSIAVTWIKKEDFTDADLAMYLSLTSVIC